MSFTSLRSTFCMECLVALWTNVPAKKILKKNQCAWRMGSPGLSLGGLLRPICQPCLDKWAVSLRLSRWSVQWALPVTAAEWMQHMIRYHTGQFVCGARGHRIVWAMVDTVLIGEASGKGSPCIGMYSAGRVSGVWVHMC